MYRFLLCPCLFVGYSRWRRCQKLLQAPQQCLITLVVLPVNFQNISILGYNYIRRVNRRKKISLSLSKGVSKKLPINLQNIKLFFICASTSLYSQLSIYKVDNSEQLRASEESFTFFTLQNLIYDWLSLVSFENRLFMSLLTCG